MIGRLVHFMLQGIHEKNHRRICARARCERGQTATISMRAVRKAGPRSVTGEGLGVRITHDLMVATLSRSPAQNQLLI